MAHDQKHASFVKKISRLLDSEKYQDAMEAIFEQESKSPNLSNVSKLLRQKEYEEALKLTKQMKRFGNGASLVHQVLYDSSCPEKVQDAILQKFLDSQNNYPNYHPSGRTWEHDLRAFTPILWERKLYKWLERFYRAVFQNPENIPRSMYAYELIYQFVQYARWSDDPKKFGLAGKTFPSDMRLRSQELVLARLQASPFKSEEEYLLWWFKNSFSLPDSLGRLNELHSQIIKINDSNVKSQKLILVEKRAIKKIASSLTKKIRSPQDSFIRESLASDIEKLFDFLIKLAFAGNTTSKA